MLHAPPSRIEQMAPLPSRIASGARWLFGARPVGANGPWRGMRTTFLWRGSRMHSTRCGVAAFQQAMAYSADGLQTSMFLLTAPGDGSAKLQLTWPDGSAVTVNPALWCPADVTGRTTTFTVGAGEA